MAIQIDKLSDKVWVLRDGSTALAEIDGGNGKVNFPGSVLNVSGKASVSGVDGGYKIARGEVTLDGGNPTVITTGLSEVIACTVTDKRATAPALDPTHFTVNYGGAVAAGTVNLYAWKPTSSSDPTLIASTDNDDVISWIAVGT